MALLGKVMGIGLLVAVLATGCGGPDSSMPTNVLSAMKATTSALNSGDAESACRSLGSISNALYEWQEFARGNQPVLIEELLARLEGISFECMRGGRVDQGEIDVSSLQAKYDQWHDFAAKNTERKSGFSTWILYIVGPAVVGGFLMYWRRKFREA